MKLKEGQLKLYETPYGKEEALYFQIDGNQHWVKRYLNHNRYEICGLLAVGGFGCVFGAYDHWNYNNKVVIKTPFYMGDFCRPFIARSQQVFERQIKTLNKLYEREKKYLCTFSNAGFDSIVNVNDYFLDRSLDLCKPFRDAAGVQYFVGEALREKAPCIVMKYIRGKELRDLINRKKISQTQVLRITRQILLLMQYLHRQRKTKKGSSFYYLLCDLKAENIIICDDEVSLIDFGAVKIYRIEQCEVDVPIFVTDGYAAPEVYSGSLEFRDNPRIDRRFDLFTVGALMVHCLTGKHPQQFLINHSPPQHDFDLYDFHNIKPSVMDIIQKATASNQDNRYSSVEIMLEDVNKALQWV